MAISIGTPASWSRGVASGDPINAQTYTNTGPLLMAIFGAGVSTGTIPTIASEIYNSVAMTERIEQPRGWITVNICELHSAAQGANTLDAVASGTWAGWGAVGVLGAKPTGAFYASGKNSGFGTTATLASAVPTTKDGIIFAICGRGHSAGISGPTGWTFMWYETETGGRGVRVAYKLTDGTSLNPVFTLASSVEWSLAVASYSAATGGSQVIWCMSKIYDRIQENRKKLGINDLKNFGLMGGLWKPKSGLVTI